MLRASKILFASKDHSGGRREGILVDLVELLAGHVRDKQAKTHPTDIQTEVNRLN